MTANINPIFSEAPDVSNNNGTGMNAAVTAAAADYTGASANNVLVFTAGVDGGIIERIRAKAIGTNVTAVARVYINNGAAHTTATNNSFYGEILLPATTVSTTAPTVDIDYPMGGFEGLRIPASFTIYVGLGAAVAAGWVFTAIGGQY